MAPGKLMQVDDRAGIAGAELAQAAISPKTPAGLYQGNDRRWARNILSDDSQLSPALWPDEVRLLGQDQPRSQRLGAWFLALALGLLAADVMACAVDIRPAAWWRLRGNLWSASHKYFSPERISTNAAGSSDSRQSCGGFGLC
jgi:hypothetical protein